MAAALRALLGSVVGLSLVAGGQIASADVRYTLSMPAAGEHLVDVELTVRAALPLKVAMPVWAPGAYRLPNWSRNVRPGTARSSTGEILTWRRSGRSGWTIAGKRPVRSPRQLTIRYQVHASTLDSDASYVDATQAHLVGSSVFMYLPAARGEPQRVTLKLPKGWQGATSTLPRHDNAFVAHGYDEIADSVWQLGKHAKRCTTFRSAELCVVLHSPKHHDVPPQWLKDLAEIARVQADWFGGLPYRRYTVFVRAVDLSTFTGWFASGLEHDRGCTAIAERSLLDAPMDQAKNPGYRRLVRTMAHEHFHVWNGRRIRPAPYGVHDYLDPKPSQLLWFTEGFTKYFDARTVLAMGREDQRRYLADLGRLIRDQQRRCPQCASKSLSDISGDAFQPSRRGSAYYTRGKLVATLLDIELRARTGGKVSLLQVLVALERRAAAAGGTVELTRELLERTIRSLSGHDLGPLLRKWVDTPGWIDPAGTLQKLGLKVREGTKTAVLRDLGFSARRSGALLVVTKVDDGGPAAKAGLKVDDRILAVGHCRISAAWEACFAKPGPLDLEVLREKLNRVRRRYLARMKANGSVGADPNARRRLEDYLRRFRSMTFGHELVHITLSAPNYPSLVPVKAGQRAAKLRRAWLRPPGRRVP